MTKTRLGSLNDSIRILFFLIMLTGAPLVLTAGEPDETGTLILKLESASSTAAREKSLAPLRERFGVARINELFASSPRKTRSGLENIYRVELHSGASVAAAVRGFAALPEVVYAEPLVRYQTQATPNDPFLASSGSWGQAHEDLWGLHRIDALPAWDHANGSGIVVAIIDSGIDFNHPDLAANLWQNPGETPGNGVDDDGNGFVDDMNGWDFIYQDSWAGDQYGHGTHVAGIVAAVADNGMGVAGVAHGARVMALQAIGTSGFGFSDDVAEALVYAADNGADVALLSWISSVESQLLNDALAFAHQAGVVLVAAAGNHNGQDAAGFHPASSRYVITVGAVAHDGTRADFSNVGWSIDLMAPGGDHNDVSPQMLSHNILSLRSTIMFSSSTLNDPALILDNDYLRWRGTSQAAAHVAGVAALVKEVFPGITPEEVRQRLRGTATPGPSGWNSETGFGTILAGSAVTTPTLRLGSARILAPGPRTLHTTSLEVAATADAAGFSFYQLDHGAGADPQSWTQAAFSAVPANDEPIATLDVDDWVDGTYTLRLSSSGSGFLWRDRVVFDLDRVEIEGLNDHEAFRAGDPISISGFAGGGAFSRFSVEFRPSPLDPWLSTGITLENGGLQKVNGALLATWDTSGITEAGAFEVRLLVERDSLPDLSETVTLIVDPTLHPGWPQSFEVTARDGIVTTAWGNVNAADLDGDGAAELLIGYESTVYVYRADGTQLPGWPQQNGDDEVFGKVLVGNLDGDSEQEVIAVGRQTVLAWHHDGTPFGTTWPGARFGSILDVDRDGRHELLLSAAAELRVLDANGQSLPGWPQAVGFDMLRAIGGDVDGDGEVEILVPRQSTRELVLFHHDGTQAAGWPVALGNDVSLSNPWTRAVLGDLDGDGRREIVVSTYGECRVFVFTADGEPMAGWPLDLPGIGWGCQSPSLADLDGDMLPEIVTGVTSLYALRADGSVLPGWPQAGSRGLVTIVDADGNGQRDVITSGHPRVIFGLQADGSLLNDFPKLQGASAYSQPAAADFDGDGHLELAAVTDQGMVLLWDLNGPAVGADSGWPMLAQNPGRSAALPLRPAPTLTIPTAISAATGADVEVPVLFSNPGAGLIFAEFSIDYDDSCLSFDPSDLDGDGIPDAISWRLPTGYERSVTFDSGDTDGEIDIRIVANDPPSAPPLAPGALATLTFTPTCLPELSTRTLAPVDFSSDPAAVFADPGGTLVLATTTDGSVEIIPSPPVVSVVTPRAGQRWALSTASESRTELVAWSASDNVRICTLEVELLFSNDGLTFVPASPGGGLPAVFDQGAGCGAGIGDSSLLYTVPETPPSGEAGSFYRVEVRAVDHEGYSATAQSGSFFMVEKNPDTYKTLILTDSGRLEELFSTQEAAGVAAILGDFAAHPSVQGKVVDLADLASPTLRDAWRQDPGDPVRANDLLFAAGGAHDGLLALLTSHTGIEYLVLVGDDRVVPMARIADHTAIFPETHYVADDPTADADAELRTGSTSVGRALAANKYLSDDPLAVLVPVRPQDLDMRDKPLLPDLAVGRLVETPAEITRAIAFYLSLDGVLDLSLLPADGNKVLVTGYDFLLDSGKRIRQMWQEFYAPPVSSTAPVDGELFDTSWGQQELLSHLCGNGGLPYPLLNFNGHATHYEEGVPALGGRLEIQGLDTTEIISATACGAGPLRLHGGIVYAGGCHEGLPVAGTTDPDEHPLDLPQTMLSLGVMSYVANTGYGWGLLCGMGYSERMAVIFTEELTRGGTLVMGETVRRAKRRYFFEAPGFDIYDVKTSMQWTLFGFPMYRLKTGVTPSTQFGTLGDGAPPKPGERSAVEHQGPVTIRRHLTTEDTAAPVPALGDLMTRDQQSLEFGPGTYRKFFASGAPVPDGITGCPVELDPESSECSGCYYTLNGLVERSTGMADVPIQPYFVYDSSLSGTVQHGVLWLGGSYDEETGWVPLFADLVSNGGALPNHGVAPQKLFIRPRGITTFTDTASKSTKHLEDEQSTVVVTTGEVVDDPTSPGTYGIERLFRRFDMELFYIAREAESTCDRQAPGVDNSKIYHQVHGTVVDWAVTLADSDIWRVVVVYDDEEQNEWVPLELVDDGSGTWRGSLAAHGMTRLTYFLQAVDHCGNVGWLDYPWTSPPTSGVDLVLPWPVEDQIGVANVELAVTLADNPDPAPLAGTLSYRIEVENQGLDPATSVVLTHALPQEVAYQAADGDGWTCGHDDRTVTCLRSRLDKGPASPILLFVTAPAAEGTLSSEVCVRSAETGEVCDLERTAVMDLSAQIFLDDFESGDCLRWNAGEPSCQGSAGSVP